DMSGPIRRGLQKGGLALGSLLRALALCEGAPRIEFRGGAAAAAKQRAAFLETVTAAQPSSAAAAMRLDGHTYRIHPYLGSTFEPRTGQINNHGFPTTFDYPLRRKERTYIIGMFGGSVPGQIMADHPLPNHRL